MKRLVGAAVFLKTAFQQQKGPADLEMQISKAENNVALVAYQRAR